jgi:hypothetical protein
MSKIAAGAWILTDGILIGKHALIQPRINLFSTAAKTTNLVGQLGYYCYTWI